MFENQRHFLKVEEELDLYLVTFNETNQIISKTYFLNYEIGRDKYQPRIMITHYEYIFLSNDNLRFGGKKIEIYFCV